MRFTRVSLSGLRPALRSVFRKSPFRIHSEYNRDVNERLTGDPCMGGMLLARRGTLPTSGTHVIVIEIPLQVRAVAGKLWRNRGEAPGCPGIS